MPSRKNKLSSRSLTASIIDSLNEGEMSPKFEELLLTSDKTQVRQKDETEYWDYKEDIDVANPIAVAKLAKLVLGFHNSKGGALIYGISNSYRVVGIYEHQILDSIRLIGILRKYIGPNVSLFQNRITCSLPNRYIWVIFIPKRKETPVHCYKNGPRDKKGNPLIKKDQYYIRINDEVTTCISPNDYVRLFSGVSFKHLNSYSYEVDDTYFRLLAPHHSQFVGRNHLLQQVQNALSPTSRSYIIALEGVGGVGKSALAIEIVRKLYRAGNYQFVVSLSAKNRVWHMYNEARQAGFSGFTELLLEIAKVFDLESNNRNLEELVQDIYSIMEGNQGLLLIDNAEEINDPQVFTFLKDIPNPVKILLTSRVGRYVGLPAESIFVTEMDKEEARSLLELELDRAGYYSYINEQKEIEEIIKVTGCLPLAIKWAASLATTYSSLKDVSRQLRSHNMSKEEFLNFCYSTMYEELSEIAQNVALLCPYLGDDWNIYNISIALSESEDNILDAISELENKGILSKTVSSSSESFSILPLTMDFLFNKWNENSTLKKDVQDRFADAIVSADRSGNPLCLPTEEKVSALYQKALEYEENSEFKKALRIVNLALQYAVEKKTSNNRIDTIPLQFLQGKLFYLNHQKPKGIGIMKAALDNSSDGGKKYPEDQIFLAQAQFNGAVKYESEAISRVINSINVSHTISEQLIYEFCNRVLKQQDYKRLEKLMLRTQSPKYAYWIVKNVEDRLGDSQFIFNLGDSLVSILRLAASSELPSKMEKDCFQESSDKVSADLKRYQ